MAEKRELEVRESMFIYTMKSRSYALGLYNFIRGAGGLKPGWGYNWKDKEFWNMLTESYRNTPFISPGLIQRCSGFVLFAVVVVIIIIFF